MSAIDENGTNVSKKRCNPALTANNVPRLLHKNISENHSLVTNAIVDIVREKKSRVTWMYHFRLVRREQEFVYKNGEQPGVEMGAMGVYRRFLKECGNIFQLIVLKGVEMKAIRMTPVRYIVQK